jgi:tRNA threonylcarbamoyladenosine biosynthesis protein TsaE
MAAIEIETKAADETRALGAAIGERAEPGDVLLLIGEFGAGKTTLVQGIARGLGIAGPVTSPSFVIANEHRGRIPLYHVDLYRVESMDRATLEALAEYFDSDGICVVEWPDSLPTDLVESAVRIHLEVTGQDTRSLRLENPPERIDAAFEAWRQPSAPPGRP